jgi:hypothetical protein
VISEPVLGGSLYFKEDKCLEYMNPWPATLQKNQRTSYDHDSENVK